MKKSISKNPEDVMISTSILDLEKMLEGVESNTSSKFEKYFIPALGVFSTVIFGMFFIIYSITTDMTRLADSMDPNMGKHMNIMSKSIKSMASNITKMTNTVTGMSKTMEDVRDNTNTIAVKMDNLEKISTQMSAVSTKMDAMKPMLINMEEINQNMKNMHISMQWMQRDLGNLRSSVGKPLKMFNAVPFF